MPSGIKIEARVEASSIQILKQKKHFVSKGIASEREADDVIEFRISNLDDKRIEIETIDPWKDYLIYHKD